MGTCAFDGREHRYVEYPIAELLHMMGRACRPGVDDNAVCVIMCHTPRKKNLLKVSRRPR